MIPESIMNMINDGIRYAKAASQLEKIYGDLSRWCDEFNDVNYNRSRYLCRDALDLLCQATVELEKAREENE